MDWLVPFILGWWGSHWWHRNWWPGIEYDAPKPGGGDPWLGLGLGLISGIAAVIVVRLTGMNSDPMPGVIAAIASGGVASSIIATVVRGMRGTTR
jgi:hypothetical protein